MGAGNDAPILRYHNTVLYAADNQPDGLIEPLSLC